MQQTKVAMFAAGAISACLLAGCSPQAGAAGPTTTAPASSAATTPSSTPTTSAPNTTAPSTSPQPTRAPTTSAALAAALNKLSADSRALKSDAALSSVRSSVSSGLVAARKGLQAARAAAYPDTTRDCGRVSSSLGSAQAGSAAAARAGVALTAAAAARQKQIDALNASIALTRKLGAGQPKEASPSPAEIDAAVKAASAQAAVEATTLRDTRASTADGVLKARENAATAADIYSKVC
jgi:hypothetical protein